MERNLEQFDLRSTCVDLLKNIWVILLAVIAAYFGVTGFYQLQYVPGIHFHRHFGGDHAGKQRRSLFFSEHHYRNG